MRSSITLLLHVLISAGSYLLFSCNENKQVDHTPEKEPKKPAIFKIAFGSCAHQEHPLPILDHVVEHKPDVFVFLGDNIYGDTNDMKVLRKKYQQLGNNPAYKNLASNVEILATWDDHDYGRNDAGKEYPYKNESKKEFLNFFKEPEDSERWQHEGIYTSEMRDVKGHKIQILLLDGRSFRDPVLRYDPRKRTRRSFYRLAYEVHTDKSKAFLGEAQWQWLEKELKKQADFRIIATGTQFGISYNGYEAWANFPHEQKRLMQLIKSTKAENLVFISGDVHYAEVSKLENKGAYPLYDFTASGLSETWKFATPNKNRIEGPIMDNHFGILTINFDAPVPFVKGEVYDIRKNQRIEYTVPLSELKFPDNKRNN